MLQRSISLPENINNMHHLAVTQGKNFERELPILAVRTASMENVHFNLMTLDEVDGIKLKAFRVKVSTPMASVSLEVDRHSKERKVNVGMKVFGIGAELGMEYEKTPNTKKSKESDKYVMSTKL